MLANQLEVTPGLGSFERQYPGIEGRRFRFDFAYPNKMIALEVEGGTWGGGSRHTSGAGFARDCEKYNLAQLAGWKVYRFTSDRVKSGEALSFIKQVFGV